MASTPGMQFRNYGGIHQFTIASDADLACIDGLDPARWAATSAPLGDLHCDPAFLAALDPAGTGRIRVEQLIAARDWLFERLARRDGLARGSDVLVLDDLDATSEVGARLRSAAALVISTLKVADPARLSLADVRAFRAGYAKTLANGDGVVPPEALAEPEVARLAREVIATTGGAKDGSGADGVGEAELDRFLERARAWLAWRERARSAMPYGEETGAAAALVDALDGKVEEYFWHCDLLRQEGHSADALRLTEEELRALRAREAGAIVKHLADSPLASPSATGALPLAVPVNPVYQEPFEALRSKVLARVAGRVGDPSLAAAGGAAALTRDGWRQVKAVFEPYNEWRRQRPVEDFDALGEARVRAIIDGDGSLPARLRELIAVDKAAAGDLEQVAELEKLVLLQRGLIELANNFVNFSSIYRPDRRALVKAGSMVIDGRRLDFCLRVADRAAHRKIAVESLLYLVYAAISAKDGAAPAFEVVAPVTAGERGRLRVGKRGLFVDLDGREWDAQIVDILENPISVKEAMFAPFRRVSQFVSKKLETWVGAQQAAQEKALVEHADRTTDNMQKGAERATQDLIKPPPPAPPPPPGTGRAATSQGPVPGPGKGLDINSLILGGGIAIGGIATVFGAIFGLLASLKGWLAICGVVVAVMALSALVGWLRLRRRDMSLILEASGWALNVNMKVNRRIGRVFTYTPRLPPGSIRERLDLLKTDEDGRWRRPISLLAVALVVAAAAAWWGIALRFAIPGWLHR